MSDKTSFRDQLLAVEPLEPDVRTQIEQEIRNMMTRKLSVLARMIISVIAVFTTGCAVMFSYFAVTHPTLPLMARVGLGVGVLFSLAWTGLSVKVLRSGELHLQRDPRLIAQMVWVFTVLMVTCFLVLGMSVQDRMLGVLTILQALAFLIGAGVYWLSYLIEAATLNVKEHLLRTELQITQLLEKR